MHGVGCGAWYMVHVYGGECMVYGRGLEEKRENQALG